MKNFIIILSGVCFTLLLAFVIMGIPKETKSVPKVEEISKKKVVLDTPVEKREFYGHASYYGKKWNGRNTANMEIYDCTKLTCASPKLPFNTIIKVTNIDNNKSVKIRVNDRGPFRMDQEGALVRPLEPHPKRVLDLSRKSFRMIGDLSKGILRVKYEIVEY